jgi:protein gp37
MAEDSKIEWTKHTFNPWRGCTKVSAGCANCYAETLSNRNPAVLGEWGPNGTRVVAAEAQWKLPMKWDREAKAKGEHQRVFCASLADVFERWDGPMVDAAGRKLWATGPDGEDGTTEPTGTPLTMDRVRFRLWRLINRTPHLDWLLLTKRPENIMRMGPGEWCNPHTAGGPHWPANVWLGTSVEHQAAAVERIPHLLKVPAALRFLSLEPLLGPVDLTSALDTIDEPGDRLEMRRRGIHWCIVGGESGADARTCRVEWMRSLVEQCRAASVPCFMKQLGERPATMLPDGECWPGHSPATNPRFSGDGFGHYTVLGLKDRKGGEPAEWPADLRVRQFPEVPG